MRHVYIRHACEPRADRERPGHVIPILQQEFDDFDTEAAKFLRGELENDEFTKFRLRQGVYGQRQPDVQMIRVKLPMAASRRTSSTPSRM